MYDQRKGGNNAKLKPVQIELIHAMLDTYSPEQQWGGGNGSGDGQFWSVRALARLVEERCGVVYQSDNSYRDLFRHCNLAGNGQTTTTSHARNRRS